MADSTTFQYPIPYRNIIIIALITIPLFSISAAIPMPLLLSGNFTWHEARFGFLTVLINVTGFWIINTILIYIFARYINIRYHWLRYVASIILCAGTAFLLMYAIRALKIEPQGGWRQSFLSKLPKPPQKNRFPGPPPFNAEARPFFHLFRLIPGQSTNILILVVLEVILLRNRKNTVEKENDMLRMANLEAKHNLLKQQFQPHFLFNSLTIVKALIKKDPEKANSYVDMLSELLRYSVYSNNNYAVTVEEELKYVKTYLEMQKIRFRDSLLFSFDIPPELLSGLIPVHSIQLLAENAQKHNILTETQPLYIRVTGDAASGTISVENNLQTIPQPQSGLGLKNLTERYKLLGGETLNIIKTEEKFIVSLKILGYERSDN